MSMLIPSSYQSNAHPTTITLFYSFDFLQRAKRNPATPVPEKNAIFLLERPETLEPEGIVKRRFCQGEMDQRLHGAAFSCGLSAI